MRKRLAIVSIAVMVLTFGLAFTVQAASMNGGLGWKKGTHVLYLQDDSPVAKLGVVTLLSGNITKTATSATEVWVSIAETYGSQGCDFKFKAYIDGHALAPSENIPPVPPIAGGYAASFVFAQNNAAGFHNVTLKTTTNPDQCAVLRWYAVDINY